MNLNKYRLTRPLSTGGMGASSEVESKVVEAETAPQLLSAQVEEVDAATPVHDWEPVVPDAGTGSIGATNTASAPNAATPASEGTETLGGTGS